MNMPTDERVIEFWDRKATDNASAYHAWTKRDAGALNPHEAPLCEPDYFWRAKWGSMRDYEFSYRRLTDIKSRGVSICQRCKRLAKGLREAADAD